jgi:predicted regulator of Ras-like GTPase activity (Roadblock/LC7/MglB family)
MLGSLKKLFFKDTSEDLATSIPEAVALAPDAQWSTVSSEPSTTASNPQPATQTLSPVDGVVSSELVSLPMASVLARLPNSLASVVQSQGNGFITLSAKRIALGLPKGSVKVTFGEIRQAAPAGTFLDNARHDQVLVELPLNEILARLHPSLLARRSDQKQIQISPEITNIFGPRGEGISVSTPPVSTPKPVVTAPPLKHVASGDTSISMRNIVRPTPAQGPSVAPAPVLRVVESQPEPIQDAGPVIVSLKLICEGWPEMVRAEIAELNLSDASIALPLEKLNEALQKGKIIFAWKQICQWMQPPVDSQSGAQDTLVELPLKLIAPLFMAKHRPKNQKKVLVGEIPDLFAGQSTAKAPEPQAIETAAQPTPTVIAAPAPTAPKISVAAPAPAAPIAMKFPTAPVVHAPVASAPVIRAPAPPSTIATTPVVPVAAPIVPKPAPTPLPTPAPTIPPISPKPVVQPVEAKLEVAPEVKPNPLGEIFGQPAKHDWSPKEIVKSLAALSGITGAFVAMQDGLLVAAELPSDLKADTVAAFLPQIFGRMNQYTKELELGKLSSLTFVVENISWQIIKSGTVYLVALGKSGESLPGSKLNTIAAELGKKIE